VARASTSLSCELEGGVLRIRMQFHTKTISSNEHSAHCHGNKNYFRHCTRTATVAHALFTSLINVPDTKHIRNSTQFNSLSDRIVLTH